MVAPMRFGKTRTAITHHIPFLFKHTNTQLIILTSPLGDILVQKERLVRKTIRNLENVEYATCPIEALIFGRWFKGCYNNDQPKCLGWF